MLYFLFLPFKEFTVFFFDKRTAERPNKPRRKELVVEVLRKGYANLFQVQHNCPFTPANQNNIRNQNNQITAKFLQIVHKLEETSDTLAFACEPLFGSLANITGEFLVFFFAFFVFIFYFFVEFLQFPLFL